MKRTFIILLGCCLGLNSCYELDLNPLSQASSENWYSNETEIEMSIKDFYRDAFWPLDNEDKTDNFIYRETPSEIIKGTFNGQSGDVQRYGPINTNLSHERIQFCPIWIRRQRWVFPKKR